jgi:hypothetical protein
MKYITDNSTIDDTTTHTTTDTTEILTAIIYNQKFGKTFVPEVDGKKIMMKMLPLEEAKAAGKGSELYQKVVSTFKTVTEYLTMMQNGITPNISMHQSIRKYCGPSNDTRRKEEQRPYAGPYGHWK